MNAPARLILAAVLSGTLILLGGCSPKPVAPYQSSSASTDDDGNAIDYSSGQGRITEEVGPSEESLDAAGRNGDAVGSFGANGDQNSDEYKKMHGRSSAQMQPVYFAFDQASIAGDQIPRLEHNAQYLLTNPTANVVIEGNSDERGTNEYNLALGERRALNAKTYIIELGVDPSRIRTVSYGEERPLFTGLTEYDWSQNRRDDFLVE